MKYSFLILACMAILPTAIAQNAPSDSTLIRTVVVEQEYNPNILDASKINILPRVDEPTVVKKDIEYSNTLMPATSFGAYQQLQPLTARETQPNAKKGYARIGYGNLGNVDGKFSYLWDITQKDQLGISASVDGMNGDLTLDTPESMEERDWRSRFYRTDINLDYRHLFNKIALDLKGNFGSNVFTYRPLPLRNPMDFSMSYPDDFFDKQHHTKGQFSAGLSSIGTHLPLQFTAEIGYLFFDRKYNSGIQEKDEEHIVQTKGNFNGMIMDEHHVGIGFEMNNLIYTRQGLKNYTSLELNPYYMLDYESFKFRLGANVNLSFGKGTTIEVSPDIRMRYIFSDSYEFYLNAVGGRQLNDYRTLSALSPYWAIDLSDKLKNTYIPVDATFGFKASPVSGLWFNLYGGYLINKNDLCYHVPLGSEPYGFNYIINEDTKAFYAGADIKYSYKGLFDISLGGRYTDWEEEEIALSMKSRIQMNASLDVAVIKNLLINLGYELHIRPDIMGYDSGPGIYEMDKVNNLYAGATYNIYKGFSIFARVNNILNQKYQYFLSYPAQKINFVAGISYTF